MNTFFTKALLKLAEDEVKRLEKLHPESNQQVAERLEEAKGTVKVLKALLG